MKNVVFEVCPHCENEVKLEVKFEAQVCPHCNIIILPCSICQVSDNCLNCPLSNHSVEDVYNKYFNKMLEGTGYTSNFVQTSELYGEDDDEVDDDDPYYMMPMYEAHIEDEKGNEIDDSWTGRYCHVSSVAEELEAYISELLDQKSSKQIIKAEIIEELMKKAANKNIPLECIKMEAEEDIEKATFYANGVEISLKELIKLLN